MEAMSGWTRWILSGGCAVVAAALSSEGITAAVIFVSVHFPLAPGHQQRNQTQSHREISEQNYKQGQSDSDSKMMNQLEPTCARVCE